MNEALFVSNVLLWFVILVLIGVVVALTRQVGALLERVAPVGALSVAQGPEVGEPAPQMVVQGLGGEPIALGGVDGLRRRTLLFFLSPSCPVCKTLLPTLERIVAEESPGVRLVYASDGDLAEHRDFVRGHRLEASEYTLSRELGLAFEVAKLPYAVLIDADGTLRAKGIVNTREHLESLFEADRLGVGSIQKFVEREQIVSLSDASDVGVAVNGGAS
jgi:methylamine dehydrogenase accessory protein MauD